MHTIDILKNAKILIFKKENWTQGTGAKDIKGKPVDVMSDLAFCFCSLGAIYKTCDNKTFKEETTARKVLAKAMNGVIATFNDSHTHQEVLQKFDEAIEMAGSIND